MKQIYFSNDTNSSKLDKNKCDKKKSVRKIRNRTRRTCRQFIQIFPTIVTTDERDVKKTDIRKRI